MHSKRTLIVRLTFFNNVGSSHIEPVSSLACCDVTSKVSVVGATKMSECVTTEQSGTGMGLLPGAQKATLNSGPKIKGWLMQGVS